MPLLDRTHRSLGLGVCVIALLLQCPPRISGEEVDELKDLALPSLWVRTFDPRLRVGFKDNVLLSNRNPVESPFGALGLDLTLYRLPVDGWEYLLLTSGDYVRYFDAGSVNEEALALAQGQINRTFGQGWKLALSAEYLYFNQVFDASTFADELLAIKVEAHSMSLRPSVSKELRQGWRLEAGIAATRQLFQEEIDDYWEFGPKITLHHEPGSRTDLSLSYQFVDRLHDSREPRDEEGLFVPGETLRFYQHDFTLDWRQFWDERRRWRSATKLGLRRNLDNGGGYYDYFRPQVSEQIQFRGKTWEVRAEAKLTYYYYDRERTDVPGSSYREKTYVLVNLRGEKLVTKSMKLFAEYEHEQALSNLKIDTYRVNTVSAGLEWNY